MEMEGRRLKQLCWIFHSDVAFNNLV